MANFCDRESGILQRNLKFWYRRRFKFIGASGICAVKFHFAADFALEFFGRKISRRKINAVETARRKHFRRLPYLRDKTYCGFDTAQSCIFGSGNAPRLGANTFRFASRMRCGGAPFGALKFYKNAARLNLKF